jgi:hypothetical protein
VTERPTPKAFVTEFGVEPVRGLPKDLPKGDGILWQGAPNWWSFARRVFHVNKIAAWFLFLCAWRMLETVSGGGSPAEALFPIVILLAIGAVAIGFFLLVAWATQRTTVYTLTHERLIMRVGIALPVTINIPYGLVETAEIKIWSDGTGNIPLKLNGKDRAAYLMLWPHVRPWKMTNPQPMLRCIPDAEHVAKLLTEALPAFEARRTDENKTSDSRKQGRIAIPGIAAG